MKRATLVLLVLISACAPTLNWREVSLQGADATLMLPCKPEIERRGTMGLASCKAGGTRFALSWADLDSPAQASPALAQMRAALLAKLHAQPTLARALQVPGMTPNAQALTQQLDAPAGRGELAVFTRGLKVYQLLMLSPKVDRANAAAWEMLLGSVHLG